MYSKNKLLFLLFRKLVFLSILICLFAAKLPEISAIQSPLRCIFSLNAIHADDNASDTDEPITIALTENLKTLNPFASAGSTHWIVHRLMSSTLVIPTTSISPQPKPGLAKSWKMNTKKNLLRFQLKQSLTWSDGSPLTAEDVAFTFTAYKDTKKYHSYTWAPLLSRLKKVTVIDRHNVEFTFSDLTYEDWRWVSQMMPILKKDFYHQAKASKAAPSRWVSSTPSSGPYRLDSFVPGQNITLKRNAKWWGWTDPIQKQYYQLQHLRFMFFSSTPFVTQWIQAKKVDLFEVIHPLDPILNQPTMDIEVSQKPSIHKGHMIFTTLNLSHPLFNSIKVREALNLAFNRAVLKDRLFRNRTSLLHQVLHPRSLNAFKANPIAYNVANAKKLLAEDGWADSDKDGVIEKTMQKKPINFDFTLGYFAQNLQPVTLAIQADYKKIGIRVHVKKLDSNQSWEIYQKGKFEALLDAGPRINEVSFYSFHSDSKMNFTGFKNKAVDRWLNQLQHTFEPLQRLKIQQKLDRTISEQYPYIYGFYGDRTYYLHSSRVSLPEDHDLTSDYVQYLSRPK